MTRVLSLLTSLLGIVLLVGVVRFVLSVLHAPLASPASPASRWNSAPNRGRTATYRFAAVVASLTFSTAIRQRVRSNYYNRSLRKLR